MKKLILTLFLLPIIAKAQIFFDNGPIFNSVGTGAGGANESILYTTTFGMGTIGFGQQISAFNRVADDFIVSSTTQIDSIALYAYQTNSGIVSTINNVNFRIWNGPPDSAGSIIVFGDTTTNRLTNTSFSNTYRITETTTGNTTRPIMRNLCATPGLTLAPGTYWLDWSTGGTLASGPWQPARVPVGISVTGNGKQRVGGVWNFAIDGGTGAPAQGFPFILYGGATITSTPLTFPTVCVGVSDTQSITVTGGGLNGSSVIVGPLASFGFSASPTGPFDPTVTLTYAGSTLSTLVYVQYMPLAAGTNNGNIPIVGGGASGNIAVIANALGSPTVTASSSPSLATVCADSTITLTGGGATTYTWTDGTNTPTDGVAFTPTASSTYTVTGTTAGCSATSTISVTVNPIPIVTASASSNVTICAGSTITLTGGGATTYTWTDGTNTPSDGVAFTATASSTYTVTGTTAGCSATSTVLVTVASSGTAPTTIGDTICGPGVANLTASAATGDTLFWYAASTGGTSIAQGATYNPSVLADTTFYVEGNAVLGSTVVPYNVGLANNSGGGNQQASNNYNIFDVLAPSITIDSVTIYPGNTGAQTVNIQLSNSTGTLQTVSVAINPTVAGAALRIPVGMVIPAGTNYYLGQSSSWIDLFRNSSGVAYPYTVPGVVSITGSAAGGGFYYFFYDWRVITGTTAYCPSATRTPVFVKVNSLPNVTATASPDTVCVGSSTTLSANGAGNYTWMPGSLTGASIIESPTTTTIYTVTGTDLVTGCTNSVLQQVVVNSLPVFGTTTATSSQSCQVTAAALSTSATTTTGVSGPGAYNIAVIPHSPVIPTGVTSNGPIGDDLLSPVITLPFPFTFYGNTYSNIYISTNGFITFDPASGSGCCSGQLIPNALTPNNLIAACWEDLIINNASQFDYFTNGTSPNRKFVVRWNAADFFAGGGTNVTAQIVLNENDGSIEIHGTSGGPYAFNNATVGIENANGTLATAVPGKNSADNWTFANEAWLFSQQTTIPVTNYLWDGGLTGNIVDSSMQNTSASPSATTVYTVTATGSNSCSATTTVSVTVNALSGLLAQATSSNLLSTPGSSCDTSIMSMDATLSYYDASCNLIATVNANPGVTLDTVISCVEVLSAVQTIGGQPYLPRVYTITPTTNGPASVTLYYTDADIAAYNAAAGTFPAIPTNAGGATTASICITRVDTVGGVAVGTSIGPITMTWNATTNYWEANFPVPGFSTFYCHTCNPNNEALAIELLSFTAEKAGATSLLSWVTNKEVNNKHFKVMHSATGTNFEQVGNVVPSKAVNGNSSSPLGYSFVHTNPVFGNNYYQLEAVATDGSIDKSEVRTVFFAEGSVVTVYPNPAVSELHVDVNVTKATQASIRILDATGRVIRVVETELQKGLNSNTIDLSGIASGVYMMQVTDGKGLNFSQQFKKN